MARAFAESARLPYRTTGERRESMSKGGIAVDRDAREHHHHDHHHHDHGVHGHMGHFAGQPAARLRAAFILTLAILALEAVGGWLAGSLALLGDAAHMLTDAVAVGLAWYASGWAARRPTDRFTYGFHRAGILAALFNAATLAVVSALILYGAVARFLHPHASLGYLMVAVAAFAALANLGIARILGAHDGNLNVHGAWLHVLGDAAASGAVVVGGLLVAGTGWMWVDPLLGVGIAGLVLWGTWSLAARAVRILMEGSPFDIPLAEVAEALSSHPSVVGVHDLHVWNLDAERVALTCHLVVARENLADPAALVRPVESMLRERFGIAHSTIQVEDERHGHGESLLCTALTGPG